MKTSQLFLKVWVLPDLAKYKPECDLWCRFVCFCDPLTAAGRRDAGPWRNQTPSRSAVGSGLLSDLGTPTPTECLRRWAAARRTSSLQSGLVQLIIVSMSLWSEQCTRARQLSSACFVKNNFSTSGDITSELKGHGHQSVISILFCSAAGNLRFDSQWTSTRVGSSLCSHAGLSQDKIQGFVRNSNAKVSTKPLVWICKNWFTLATPEEMYWKVKPFCKSLGSSRA